MEDLIKHHHGDILLPTPFQEVLRLDLQLSCTDDVMAVGKKHAKPEVRKSPHPHPHLLAEGARGWPVWWAGLSGGLPASVRH